jgi:gliding motility-associated-like protein/uncharacterized repeat protein (TIGR01451 family)
MKKTFLFYILFVICYSVSLGQSFTVITSTVPTSLNTCNQTRISTVRVENPSSFLLTGVEVITSLPQGINYVAGSVTGATESNITNLNNPEFTTTNIATLTTRTISFEIETNCDVLTFLNNSGIPQNSFVVNYVGNGNNISQNHTSNNYNVAVPNLSVTSFTDQSIPNGTIGGNFTRCLTITNGGSGYLEGFSMTDIHGTGILVNSVDVGALVNSGQTETITITSADLIAFGYSDGRLKTGDTITICEDITVLNCSDILSDYDIYWGCGGQQCQNTYTSANINFGFTTPNLKFASYRSDLSTCHGLQGDNTTHGVTIANIGNGDAVNTKIDIYQGWTNAYYSSGWLSTIDTSTIMASLNGGTPFHIIADSTVASATYSYSCPSFSVGQMFLNLPTLQPNDTMVITWEVPECDIDDCSPGRRHNKGWHSKGVYYNICDERFDLDPIRGRPYDYFRENLEANLSPANITSGNTETFNFLISDFELVIRNKDLANDEFWYQIILPPCLTFANNFRILNVNDDTLVMVPTQTITSGDTVFVRLDDYGNRSSLRKGQLIFDLTANCASCGNTSGNYSIDIKSFYSPDTTCPNKNEFQLACFTQDIFVLCPVTCEGLNFVDFNIERTNIGVADNDNNGLPDAVNTPDLTKIRLDRVMYQDTFSMSYKSYIGKTGGSPDFQYLTYNSSIASGGNRLTFINGEITIFDLSTGTSYVSSGISSTSDVLSVTTKDIAFELDINALTFTPALPGGFLLEDNDTVIFNTSYVNFSNIGNNMYPCNVTNELFASNITNATTPDQYGCNDLEGYFTLIGTFFTNSGTSIYSHNSCDVLALAKRFYVSIGPSGGNYSGGNLFPYEYRSWNLDDSVTIKLPGEYELINYTYSLNYTSGYTTLTSPTFTLNPIGGNISDEFKFYTGLLFDDSIQRSDDGYTALSYFYLKPTCNTPKDSSQQVTISFSSKGNSVDNGSQPQKYNTSHWLRYDAPRIQLQSLLPSINVYDSIAEWDLNVSNTSNVSDADNFWIAMPTISGINVTQLLDVTNNIIITPTANGIYELGNLPASAQRIFKIYGSFNSCQKDSIIAHIGWGCQGYPVDLPTHTCPTDDITFYTIPKIPSLETIISSANDSINLCDTASYSIKIRNIQTGNAYNTVLTGLLPNGITIIPGSTQIKIPGQAIFTNYTDPTNTTGNIWEWNLDTNIIEGIQTLKNDVEISFKFISDCDYVSGSQFSFYSVGNAACPYTSTSATASSSPLVIKDATQPYGTDIKIITDYISPCKGNTPFGIYIKNNGPLPFTANDSIYIELPKDVNFVNGSFNGLYNAPVNGIPTINTQNIYELLTWHLPNGVAVGDSVFFAFEAKANKDSLDCSILSVRAYSTSTSIANCSASASSCTINTVTGDTTRNVFVYKSYLALSNNNSTSILNATNGEMGYVGFDIYNTGDTISAGETTYASYYWDRDNNGVLSAADTNFLTTSNTQEIVGNNSTTTFLDTINIPAGYVCNIIVVLDSNENSCICSSVQLPLSFTLNQSLTDTVVCSNNSVLYSYDSVNGYTYNWTPTINLNGYNIANPTFTYINNTNQIDTAEYFIEIDRGGCLGYDTLEIATYPGLTPNAGLDDSTCSPIYTLNGNSSRSFENGIWISSITNSSALVFSDSSLNTSNISGYTEGIYELYWGNFNGVCDTIYDTVLIYAFDIPFADAGLNDTLCNTYNYTFSANNPIGTSRGLWTQEILNPSVVTFDYDTAFNANITGLIEGTYQVYWTVSNGSCSPVTDTIIIDVFDTPISNAGVDDSLCNLYTFTLSGNQPLGRSTGLWSQNITNPSVITVDFDTAYDANIAGLIEGTYELYWTVSNGNCIPVIDTVIIDIFDTPSANAGLNDSLCNLYNYTLNGNQPIGRSTGLWTQSITNTVVITLDYDTAFDANITGLSEGTYELYWTVSNGNCTPAIDTIIIDVFNLPIADAGIDDSLCSTFTYTLNANLPIGRSRGKWMQNPTDMAGAMFDYDTAYNANLVGLVEGTYNLYWIVSNGNCTSAIDTVILEVFNAPIANAGLDDSLCGANNYTLNANHPSGRSTGDWTLAITNPTVANFSSASVYNAIVSNLIEGTYELYWTVSNGNCTPVIDTVTIDVFDLPTINAGLNDSLCDIYTYTLNGNQPIGRTRGLWSQDIANTTVTNFDFDTAYNANVIGLAEGIYTFYWTISNGNCTPLTDTVVIDVFNLPTANAGIDDSLCDIYTYTLNGNLPIGKSTGLWSQALTNPSGAIITNPTTRNSPIIDLVEGTYQLYWSVSNGNCSPAIDTVIIDVFNQPTANAGNDTILCEQTYFILTGNPALGRSNGIWTESNTNPATPIFGNTSLNITNISNIVNGVYKFYWTVNNGNCTDAIDSITIYNHPKPSASFTSNVTTICEEECIDFNASASIVNPLLGDVLVNYTWNFGNGAGDNVLRNNCYNDSGNYTVSLIIEASSGCTDTLTQNNYITVNPLPKANFSFSPEYPVIFETVNFSNESTNQIAVKAFTISDGSLYYATNFKHNFNDTGYIDIDLYVENIYGCIDSIEKTIYIKNRLFAFIPNSFSPNGDGVNEIFMPEIQNVVEDEFLFLVFNRWGNKIFETNKPKVGWNGKFQNILSQVDTYIWKLNFRVKGEPEMQTMTGYITLIR